MAINRTKFHVKGLKELEKSLNNLTEPKFRKAVLRRAGRAAMTPILNAAKANAPTLQNADKNPSAVAGALKNDIKMSTRINVNPSIHKRSGKVRKTSLHEMSVMVKTGKATEDYALVTEYGREEVKITRDQAFGRPTQIYEATLASLEPRPYMRPAMDNNVQKAISIFKSEFATQLAKQAKAQAKYFKKIKK